MLSLGCFLLLLLIGVPVALSVMAAAMLQIALAGNAALLFSVPQQAFGGIESYGLLALPVFILLGELMGESGAGRRLMALAARLVGPVPGGLAHVTLLGNAMLAAILGSTVAQIVLTSRLAVPEMERAGYPRDLAAAVTAAGGLLAPVLPPSMLFIVYGVIAQVPIGRLFIAGIVPGAAMLLGFVGVTVWLARRGDMPPPPPAPNRLATDRPARATARVMVEALPAALVPLAWWSSQVAINAAGPEPGRYLLLNIGQGILWMLFSTLSLTPLTKLTRWKGFTLIRRQLGLWTLTYALLHLFCYAVFILGLDLSRLGSEIVRRPYIIVGMLALLNPLGVVVAALFVAAIFVGADSMSRAVGVPTYLADIMLATALLLMVLAILLTKFRVRRD